MRRSFTSRRQAQQHFNITPALIWNPEIKAYDCTFPYNADLINLLKAQIPSSDRIYAPKTHKWTITEKYFPALKIILENVFQYSSLKITTKEEYESFAKEQNYGQGAMTVNQPSLEQDTATMYDILVLHGIYAEAKTLFTALDLSTLTKLYRKAALLLHPDRNPANAGEMSKLNEVFNRIKQQKGAVTV